MADSLNQNYDVIVAGEAGAGVLVLEKSPELGGATGMAVGSISASGTEAQKAACIVEDVENHLAYCLKLVPRGRTADGHDLDLTQIIVGRVRRLVLRKKDDDGPLTSALFAPCSYEKESQSIPCPAR
jgi:hypothetical protein